MRMMLVEQKWWQIYNEISFVWDKQSEEAIAEKPSSKKQKFHS